MKAARLTMDIQLQHWPLQWHIGISGRVITSTDVILVTLWDGEHFGHGECCPLEFLGYSTASVMTWLNEARKQIENGLDHASMQAQLPHGPARNALDCAWWDLKAKRAGKTIWELLDLTRPASLVTSVTIGLDTPAAMAEQARSRQWPLLKLKIGAPGDLERVIAVREAVPDAGLLVDVNQGWSMEDLECFVEPLQKLGVQAIEQPLSVNQDAELSNFKSPIPLIADESCQHNLDGVLGKYQMINIKLDKVGGLTAALNLMKSARNHDLGLMVGCMMGTSLAMAPAYVIGSLCSIVDLDAPLAQSRDRDPAIRYADGRMFAFSPDLWG